MDDRELLELAAKAVGHCLVWGEMHRVGDTDVDCTDLAYIVSGDREELPAYWNPLADDGDALRLAVKLRLAIFLELPSAVRIGPRMDSPDYWLDEGEDEFAATRRAIVRAAAEIGKAMP